MKFKNRKKTNHNVTRKTPYCKGSNIREVARLCCRCQHDTKSNVVGSIHVALWQRFTYYKTLCRCQSYTLRYDYDTRHKDLSYKN